MLGEKQTMEVLVEIFIDVEGENFCFHRIMKLPIQPTIGMEFIFELVGQSDDMKYRRHATFVVEDMRFEERPGILHIMLTPHQDEEEELTVSCFKPMVWREGQAELWLW